jgi:hypothetical protein
VMKAPRRRALGRFDNDRFAFHEPGPCGFRCTSGPSFRRIRHDSVGAGASGLAVRSCRKRRSRFDLIHRLFQAWTAGNLSAQQAGLHRGRLT